MRLSLFLTPDVCRRDSLSGREMNEETWEDVTQLRVDRVQNLQVFNALQSNLGRSVYYIRPGKLTPSKTGECDNKWSQHDNTR